MGGDSDIEDKRYYRREHAGSDLESQDSQPSAQTVVCTVYDLDMSRPQGKCYSMEPLGSRTPSNIFKGALDHEIQIV